MCTSYPSRVAEAELNSLLFYCCACVAWLVYCTVWQVSRLPRQASSTSGVRRRGGTIPTSCNKRSSLATDCASGFYAHVHNLSPNMGRSKMASRTRPLFFTWVQRSRAVGTRLRVLRVLEHPLQTSARSRTAQAYMTRLQHHYDNGRLV